MLVDLKCAIILLSQQDLSVYTAMLKQ